jgi:hypothetical protein
MMELFPQPQPAASPEGTQQPPVGGPRFTPADVPAMPGMSREVTPAIDPMNGMHTSVGNLDFGFNGSAGASPTVNPHPDADWHELWQEEAPGFEELMPGGAATQTDALLSPYAGGVAAYEASGYGMPAPAAEATMNPIGFGGDTMSVGGAVPQPQTPYEQPPYAPEAAYGFGAPVTAGAEQGFAMADPYAPPALSSDGYGNPSLPQPGTPEWQQWSPQPDYTAAPQGYAQGGYGDAPPAYEHYQAYANQPGPEYAPAGYSQEAYAQQQYAPYAPQPEPHVTFGPAPQETYPPSYSPSPVYGQPVASAYSAPEPVYTPQPEQLVYAEAANPQGQAAEYPTGAAPAPEYDAYTQAAVDAYYAAQAAQAQQQQVEASQVISSASMPQSSMPMEDLSFLWYPQQFQSIQTETLQWVQFDEQAQQIRFQPLGQVMLGWYVEPIHQQKIPVLIGQTGLRCTILKVLNPETLIPSVEGARLRVVHLAIVNEHPAFQIAVQDAVVGWALINELGMLFYDTPVLPQHLA